MGKFQRTLLGAAAASVALGAYHDRWSRGYMFKIFAAVWFVELVAWAIWGILIYPHYVSPMRHLPTVGGSHWFLGHGRKIMAENNGAPGAEWIATVPNEGLIRYFWLFNIERVLLSNPKALSEVLVSKANIFPKPDTVRTALTRIMGETAILLTEGDQHAVQRRNLQPAFSFRHVKDLYPIFWSKSREVVQAMTTSCGPTGEAEMDIYPWASRCTLDIIGLAGMGRDFGAIQNENNELVQTYQRVFNPSTQSKILGLLGQFIPTALLRLLPIQRNEDLFEASRKIRAVSRDLIREKKARLATKEQLDVDILSVALESGKFSDESLVDQIMTFLAAGHETTASTIAWAVYALCRFPEMQKRLREEVRANLPSVDADQEVTSMEIDHMPYLNAFCNEVLRYSPSVPMTVRRAACDTTILGQPIVKGTQIQVCSSGINIHKELWGSDANEFNPERWLAASGKGPEEQRAAAAGGATSNYAFMTFLQGTHNCIGQGFAKAEFACLLAAWVGRFEFSLVNEADMDEAKMEVKSGITMRPKLRVRTKVIEGY